MTGATASPVVDRASVERFRAEGFVLLRNAFDPGPLADELDTALRDGLRADAAVNLGSGGVRLPGCGVDVRTDPRQPLLA